MSSSVEKKICIFDLKPMKFICISVTTKPPAKFLTDAW